MKDHVHVILSVANQRSTPVGAKVKDLSADSASNFARCFTSFNMTRYVLDNIYIITKIKLRSLSQANAVIKQTP